MMSLCQRQPGASNSVSRHTWSELLLPAGGARCVLTASLTACAYQLRPLRCDTGLSRPVPRSNCLLRRAPAGTDGNSILSRSRASLLVFCAGAHGIPSDDAASSGEPQQWTQPQHQGMGSTDMRAPDEHASAFTEPPSKGNPLRPRNDQNWDFIPEPYVPSPSNLPTHEDDEPLLYPPRLGRPLRKDLWTLTDKPGVDLFLAGPLAWSRLFQVYVILFGVGERDTEGIYSLRAFGTDGIPHETIIAFECEEEALRYAGLLEASMEHTPHVCAIPPRDLLSFCLDQAYSCRLEPRGSLLIPPDFNVSVTDWERSMRLRDGKFAVLDSEPELAGAAGGGSSATATVAPPATGQPASGAGAGVGIVGGVGNVHVPRAVPSVGGASGGPASSQPSALARYSGLSGDELADIRARLEALLPPGDV